MVHVQVMRKRNYLAVEHMNNVVLVEKPHMLSVGTDDKIVDMMEIANMMKAVVVVGIRMMELADMMFDKLELYMMNICY